MVKHRIRPTLLRQMTVRRVLEVLQQHGPLSRAELTRKTGISAPTVSNAVNDLLELGLVEEQSPPKPRVGRPARRIGLACHRAYVVGVTLQAPQCELTAAGLAGQVRPGSLMRFPTPGSYRQLLRDLVQAVRRLQQQQPGNLLAVGMSVPGLVDAQNQQVLLSPNLGILNGQSPARDLQQRLQVECAVVHDTFGLCLAERMFEGAARYREFAVVDATSGLGLGVISQGRLLTGHRGVACELGHLTAVPDGELCGCGNRGCLETVASDPALLRRVCRRLGTTLSMDQLIRMARKGEIQIEEELRYVSEYMAIALASVMNLFNPQMISVHARMFDVQDGLFRQVVALARRRALAPSQKHCRIRRLRSSKRQGAIAGAIHHLTSAQGPSVP